TELLHAGKNRECRDPHKLPLVLPTGKTFWA
ncbi:uncharacterized protein METZ01_LOCUS164870, partial [marine metagenome]